MRRLTAASLALLCACMGLTACGGASGTGHVASQPDPLAGTGFFATAHAQGAVTERAADFSPPTGEGTDDNAPHRLRQSHKAAEHAQRTARGARGLLAKKRDGPVGLRGASGPAARGIRE